MSNIDKLKDLLVDILLIEEEEFTPNLKQTDIDTWDSLAVVSVAVGLQDTFGYHPTPDEAVNLTGVNEIIQLLEKNGVSF